MPFPLLLLGAIAGLFIWRKAKDASVVGAGPPGTIVDVNPIMGHRQASVSQGQTIRVNLPREWILLQDAGADPTQALMQPVPSRGLGGMTFTAAAPGTEKLTFAKGGTTETITIEFDIAPMQMAASGYYGTGYRRVLIRPYRDFWRARFIADPSWRWREQQWRLHRYWEPAWGAPPPPPADPIADTADAPDAAA
jgi:hypothetical protein